MLEELHSQFNGGEISTVYYGLFSEKIIEVLSDTVRKSKTSAQKSIDRKIFSGFVEVVMNILHHSPISEINPMGIIIIGQQDDHFFIMSGNKIKKAEKEAVKNTIDPITKMSSEEIYKAYWKQLRKLEEESEENNKGAGLGILTLARNASSPIEYFFKDIPSDVSYDIFFIKANFK
jgi:Family of unknown function (DUF6272)